MKILLVCLQIAVVTFFHQQPVFVFVVTSAIAAAFLATLRFARPYVHSFFLFGILGAAAEFFPVMYGAWSYATAVPIGLPAYLPVIWGTAGVAIIHTAQKLNFYGNK